MQRFFRFVLPNEIRSLTNDPTNILKPVAMGIHPVRRNCLAVQMRPTKCVSRQIDALNHYSKRTMKIYTRTGDKGFSNLFTGERRPKTDRVFQALGTVDELSCTIAVALAHIHQHTANADPNIKISTLCDELERIQCRLQAVGSSIATPLPEPENELPTPHPRRTQRYAHIDFPDQAVSGELEPWIDRMTTELPPLRQFILPSGGLPGSTLHLARAVCRRAERRVVLLNTSVPHPVVEPEVIRYLNRLSDYLFTAARYGGGGGGHIRDAGGSFGKREAKHEEEYFHRKVS
ncbi:hypothetical protein T265_14548, partial [Opisthorchis viverrini]